MKMKLPKMEMSCLMVTLDELLGDYQFSRKVDGLQSVVKNGPKTIKVLKMFVNNVASDKELDTMTLMGKDLFFMVILDAQEVSQQS